MVGDCNHSEYSEVHFKDVTGARTYLFRSNKMSDDNPPVDHVLIDEERGTSAMEENLKSKPTWMRLVFMILFSILASVTSFVASIVVGLGFLWVLFTGETNKQLQALGKSIASYLYQILCYLTYNSDDRPFPFELEWPAADDGD